MDRVTKAELREFIERHNVYDASEEPPAYVAIRAGAVKRELRKAAESVSWIESDDAVDRMTEILEARVDPLLEEHRWVRLEVYSAGESHSRGGARGRYDLEGHPVDQEEGDGVIVAAPGREVGTAVQALAQANAAMVRDARTTVRQLTHELVMTVREQGDLRVELEVAKSMVGYLMEQQGESTAKAVIEGVAPILERVAPYAIQHWLGSGGAPVAQVPEAPDEALVHHVAHARDHAGSIAAVIAKHGAGCVPGDEEVRAHTLQAIRDLATQAQQLAQLAQLVEAQAAAAAADQGSPSETSSDGSDGDGEEASTASSESG